MAEPKKAPQKPIAMVSICPMLLLLPPICPAELDAESNREFLELLRAKGNPAVWGDATDPEVLSQAHIKDARALVIATPETVQVRRMVETARTLDPPIRVAVRSHSADEAERLEKNGTGTVFVGERELAKSMVGFVLSVMTTARRAGQ